MIKRINYEETYPIRHTVMWPDKPLDYIKVNGDEEAIHYGLFINGKLTSVISLFKYDKTGQFRKFATLIEEQGKGHGTKLLNYLIKEARALKLETLKCNARIEKKDFYKRFGLEETEESFEKSGKYYIIMSMKLEETGNE